MNKMNKVFIVLFSILSIFNFGCASIDYNDSIIDAECAVKNSVPSIHDE